MTDNRIALCKDSKIHNSDKTISIKEEIGRGARCIVYDALCIDGIGAEHIIRVKECYPAYLLLCRTEEGTIVASEKDAEEYKEAKDAFIQAYRKNVSLRGTLGIINSTVDSTDIFENNNTVYTVMAMDEGIDYSKYKDSSLKELFEHIKTLSELIMKYHEHGYLHLDIKPENVFILPETVEHILLFDFDSVTTLEELRTAGRYKLSFSEGFSAPEQIQGRVNRIDKYTDIYSIGAMLFFKLFNRKAELEDCQIYTKYCFEDMYYPNKKYHPRLYIKLEKFFRNTLVVSPVARWKEMPPVIDTLKELIELSDIEGIYLLDSFGYNSANFVGRQKETEDVKNTLANNQLLFLSGIGGIGKTELAKQYANKYRDQYDAIIFAVFEKSIQSLVCDEIGINKISREEDESEKDYYKRKIEIMKQTVTPKDLIIIDNFDIESDENLEELFSCPCKFIVTTRMDFRDYNYRQISVDKIDDISDILSLFHTYNNTSYSDEENEAIEKLIEYVEFHTMTVELIAKYLRNSSETPIELYEKFLEKEGTANTEEIRVKQRKDSRLSAESVNTHLRTLFDVSGFDIFEKEIISSLSLFAGVRIRKSKFNEICAVKNIENKLDGLVRKGWIEYNEHSEKISLHQVIQDLIYNNLEPNAGNCSHIVYGMCEYMTAETVNNSDRAIRRKLFDVLMSRLSGDSIPYARLCMIYGKEDKLDEAEKICLACDGAETFDLLQRIYRKKIVAVGECNDMFDTELDVDKYIIRQLVLVNDMFDKVILYCRKSSEDPDYLAKEYIDAGCETDRVISDNIWWNSYAEGPIPKMDEVFRKIIRIFDEAAELLPGTTYTAAEKERWYAKIRDFYMNKEFSALYREKYFLDLEKAYKYQEIIDRLREESQEKNADIVITDETGIKHVWGNDVRCSELAEKYEEEGKYEKAIEYYRKAYDEDDELYETSMQNIAHVYLKWGKPDIAIGYLEKILEVEKEMEQDPDAYFFYSGYTCVELVRTLIQQGDIDGAKKFAKELIYYEEPDTLDDDNLYSLTYVIAGYYFLYSLEDDQSEKKRLWQQCLKYYEMLGDREIDEDILDFVSEYLERSDSSYLSAIKIVERIVICQERRKKENIIHQMIDKYCEKEDFHKAHIILLLKLAELTNEYPYENVKDGIRYCDEAEEYYNTYELADQYVRSLIHKTRADIMYNDHDYESEQANEEKKMCDFRLLAEQEILEHNYDDEKQIEVWTDAASQYGYLDDHMMQIVCLNKALEIARPILYQDECRLFVTDYQLMMQSLIYAYIDSEAFEEANNAIHELHDRTVEYMIQGDDSDALWKRVWSVSEIADYYTKISRNMDAAAEYLRAMYVGLEEQMDIDLMTEENVTKDFIERLCEVVGKLLDREVDPEMADSLIDLRDNLVTYRDKNLDKCEAYDSVITKISNRFQQQEIEFKR